MQPLPEEEAGSRPALPLVLVFYSQLRIRAKSFVGQDRGSKLDSMLVGKRGSREAPSLGRLSKSATS